MSEKTELKQRGNIRTWLIVMTSFALVFGVLSAVQSISLPASLGLAALIVVVGAVLLKVVK